MTDANATRSWADPWAIVIGQWAHERDVVFGVTAAGRPPEVTGIERAVGLFINTLPARVDIDPDAIVISWCGVETAKYRPDVVLGREGCSDMRAVREGNVFCVAEAHLGRPGPRLTEGLQELEEIVRASSRAP